jgi:lysophospholipase L1-like esterase
MVSGLKKCSSFLLLILALTVFSAERKPTIWIIGDSIFQTYKPYLAPLTGIGQELSGFCKPGVKVQNRAVSGTSTKSFRDRGYWKPIAAGMRKGDFLLIQFGHNDQKRNKPKVYAEAKTDYYQNLVRYIKEARGKGANPVLITSMCRRRFKNGRLVHTLKDYPKYCRLVGKNQNVPILELNKISFAKVNAMGEAKSEGIYNNVPEGSKYTYWTTRKGKKSHTDNTHLNTKGAKLAAGWLVADAKQQKLELAKLFK